MTEFPPGSVEDFYRIWRKHAHMEHRDEYLISQLKQFSADLQRPKHQVVDTPRIESLIIARYSHKEHAERAQKELVNLGATASVESVDTE
ncbi:MAG: hypothetical protein CMH54_07180 [Myxococcales bacterium]|nr:hypothetical protein [Myxococcales bacterium]|tara:strand:+ start:2177 stop:2446 length:270 start_codon:yes stop_codon:yes gene_type:complete